MSERLSDEAVEQVLMTEDCHEPGMTEVEYETVRALAWEVQERRRTDAATRGHVVWHRHSGGHDLTLLAAIPVEVEARAAVSVSIFVPAPEAT